MLSQSLDRCHILLIPAVEAWLEEQERPTQMIHNHHAKFNPNFCLCRAVGMCRSPKKMPLLVLFLKVPCYQKSSLAWNQVLGHMEFIILKTSLKSHPGHLEAKGLFRITLNL